MARISTQLIIEGVNRSREAFNQVRSDLGSMGELAKGAGAQLAGLLTVGAFVGLIKGSIEAADEVKKLAQSAGTTTETFTGLQFAFGQSGVETAGLSDTFNKLNKTMADADAGGQRSIGLFNALGVSIYDAEGSLRAGDAVLLDIADRFKEMPDGVEKSALAIELFGKSGAKLVPLLNSGSDGIKELTDQAERLGLIISDQQAVAAEQFGDSLSVLGSVSTGAANTISGELLPTLNEMTGLLVDLTQDGESATAFAQALGGALKILAVITIAVGTSFLVTGRYIGAAAAAAVAAAKGDFAEAAQIFREASADNEKTSRESVDRIAKILKGGYEAEGAAATETARKLQIIRNQNIASAKEAATEQAKAYKDLVASAKAALSELVSTERKATSDLEKLRADRLDIDKRYADASQKFSGGPGAGSYLQALDLKQASQRSLKNGDIEGAKRQAQEALAMLEALADAGQSTYGFEDIARGLRDVENAANDIEQSNAADKIKDIGVQIKTLKAEIEAVTSIKIDAELSAESKAQLFADMQALAAAIGQQITIQPQLALPAPGTADADGYVFVPNDPPPPQRFATGGRVRGPGTGTSDSIMARLSNGEYVIRAAAVKHFGVGMLDKMNGLQLPGFADGGLVGAAMSVPDVSAPEPFGNVYLDVDGRRVQMQAGRDAFNDLHLLATKKGRTKV